MATPSCTISVRLDRRDPLTRTLTRPLVSGSRRSSSRKAWSVIVTPLMKKRWLVSLALLALSSCSPPGPYATLVLRGGRIYTVNTEQPWAEAVAVSGENILAAGGGADVERFIGPETVVVELEGRLVLPGLIDSHLHLLGGSLLLDQVRLDEARSLEEMQQIVRLYAEAHPGRGWIVGRGWNYTHVDGGRLPTRQDLDEIVPERPVFLLSYDSHTAWVNSKALEAAGVDGQSTALGPGEVVRHPLTGDPTGALKEEGAVRLVRRAIPGLSRGELLAALRNGMAYAHRFGITSIQIATGIPRLEEGTGYPDDDAFDLFEELARRGELRLRVYAAMSVHQSTTEEELNRFSEMKSRYRGPWLKAGAVKLFMDGVIESHTAAMLEPYANAPEERGATNYRQEEIDELVSELDRRGLQIFTHAIGDRSIRMVLDAYQKAARENGPSRHRIEHVEVISEADVPRFAWIGVIAAMQPLHGAPDFGGVWTKAVGPERIERAFAWKSLRRAGARVVHGSDWPVVTLDPLVGIHTAVTRQDLDQQPEGGWIPSQRLTLEEAIAGYTLDAAYASFEEDIKGSIEAGKLADLVVLSHDLFKVLPGEIAETEVMMTVVGGEVVYISPRFLPEEMRRTLSSMNRRGER